MTASVTIERSPAHVPPREDAVAVYRDHGQAIRAFLSARIRDRAAVEDLCQETFLAFLSSGIPREEASRWLFGVARNKALKWLRDRETTAAPDAERAAAPGPSPVEAVGGVEDRARVRAAVLALEDDLREVVLLRYEGALDTQAIAERLAVPATTVQGRLKRAREALRRTLS